MSVNSLGDSNTRDEPVLHNSVLIQTREPARLRRGWVAPMFVGLAVVIAAGVWVLVETHPGAPIVNHAVAASQNGWGPSSGS